MKAKKISTTEADRQPTPPFPAKKIKSPGLESDLEPKPHFRGPLYRAAGKLKGKKALITGGDSGIRSGLDSA